MLLAAGIESGRDRSAFPAGINPVRFVAVPHLLVIRTAEGMSWKLLGHFVHVP